MENIDRNKSDVQEQGPKKGIVIIVITILLGTNGLLLWQFFDKKNNLDVVNQTLITTTAEKDALQTQLNQVKAEYEKEKSENADLQNQLSSKDEEIKAKVLEIQRLISSGGPAQISRAKAELERLKELNTMYSVKIDSLNKVNKELETTNQNLTSSLTEEKSKIQGLNSEKSKLEDKVKAGSVLSAVSATTEGQRFKSNGKTIITDKARQVTQIHTRFTLGENRLTEPGPQDIYLRVFGPDGSVMPNPTQETFVSQGQTIVYTVKVTVDYPTNAPVDVAWAKGAVSTFTKGTYNVEIYHKGFRIGTSKITLK